MKKFDEQLLRLKQVVKLPEDQDVAALLGLSKAAFSDRKKRDAFPDDKLAALAIRRPELGIDVSHVITGKTRAEIAAMAQGIPERIAQAGGPAGASLEEVKRFITEHPDVDVVQLLTGQATPAVGDLPPVERTLIANYRAADAAGQALIAATAAMAAKARAVPPPAAFSDAPRQLARGRKRAA